MEVIGDESKWTLLNCEDCRWNTGVLKEYYIVDDHIWEAAIREKPAEILCIGCLEERIGRKLVPADFPPIPINDPRERGNKFSTRLRKRLGL